MNACKQIPRFFAVRRQLLQMMQTEANLAYWRKGKIRQRWLNKRKMLVNALADIFYEGIAEGIVRPDVSAEAMAAYFLGLLRTRARDLQDIPENMKNCKLLVDMFLNGVCTSHDNVLAREMAIAKVDSKFLTEFTL